MATKKATGKRERPDPSILKIQIDALVVAHLQQLGLAKATGKRKRPDPPILDGVDNSPLNPRALADLIRDGSRRFAEEMLKSPAVIRATDKKKERLAEKMPLSWEWLVGKLDIVERYHREEFIKSHHEDVKQIAGEFSIQLTDERAKEVLAATWDIYARAEWIEIRGLGVERDREYLRRMERHYNSLRTKLLNSLHLPCSGQASAEIGVVLGVLDALRVENEKRSQWKKEKGFTQPKGDLKRQGFWTEIILRVVDLTFPMCKRVRGEWENEAIRARVFKFTAELLNKCYPPGGWKWESVRARWLRAKGLA